MRALNASTSDFPAIFMQALRTIDRMEPFQYEIILDCAGFEEDSGIPIAFLQTFTDHTDPPVSSKLHSIHIYSPSSSFVTYFKKVLAMLPGRPALIPYLPAYVKADYRLFTQR
jgi:hypothetical protein